MPLLLSEAAAGDHELTAALAASVASCCRWRRARPDPAGQVGDLLPTDPRAPGAALGHVDVALDAGRLTAGPSPVPAKMPGAPSRSPPSKWPRAAETGGGGIDARREGGLRRVGASLPWVREGELLLRLPIRGTSARSPTTACSSSPRVRELAAARSSSGSPRPAWTAAGTIPLARRRSRWQRWNSTRAPTRRYAPASLSQRTRPAPRRPGVGAGRAAWLVGRSRHVAACPALGARRGAARGDVLALGSLKSGSRPPRRGSRSPSAA